MTVSVDDARYTAASPTAAKGWRLERLTAPSRLFGANGLRNGPDGHLVATVPGSQISALDLGTGLVDTVSARMATSSRPTTSPSTAEAASMPPK